MVNNLVQEANELLKNGSFNYAFWEDRDKIIEYMLSKGYKVYEMLGGGRAHPITSTAGLVRLKKNIFCCLEDCPLVKTYPVEEDGNCWMEFFHVGQTKLDYIEFLFNDKSVTHFEYSRNREISVELSQAILFAEDIPYLAPEIILLYKSTDIDRQGYQQDFELAYQAMSHEQKQWLQDALKREFPNGHKWIK